MLGILINWMLVFFFFTVPCHPLRADVYNVLGGTALTSTAYLQNKTLSDPGRS